MSKKIQNAASPGAPALRVEVKVMRLSNGQGLPLPQYHSEDAAGLDLHAAVPAAVPLRLLPGKPDEVPTGIALEIPRGFEAQVRPRSGLARDHGVTVLNSPGTIDADYRGEVKVLLINHSRDTFVITRGQRIAQLVVHPVARAVIIDANALSVTRRGEAGFGSTGFARIAPVQPTKPAPRPSPSMGTARPAAKAAARPPAKVAPARPTPAKPAPMKSSPAKAAAKTVPKAAAKAAPKPAVRSDAKSKAAPKKTALAARRPARKGKSAGRG